MDADFVTVAEAASFSEADRLFDSWLVEQGLQRDDLAEHDLLVDSGRSDSALGWRRYRVRKAALTERS